MMGPRALGEPAPATGGSRNGRDPVRRAGRTSAFTIILLLFAALWFFPVLWLAIRAFAPNALILRQAARLVPTQLTTENFRTVLDAWPFFRWFLNSLIVTVGALAVTTLVSLLAAFSFSRFRWRGRDAVFLLFLASMFIPWEINAIPLYFIANYLNLLNTHPGIFLPISAMPIGMFLIRQFFINIPQDLEDAARIDGCRSIGVLFRIFVPMSLPAIGALVIWVFIFSWNEFFWSLISLQRSRMMTLPIGLRLILGAHNIAYGNLFAASVIAMVPSILVYALLRRHIIRGISISGALK